MPSGTKSVYRMPRPGLSVMMHRKKAVRIYRTAHKTSLYYDTQLPVPSPFLVIEKIKTESVKSKIHHNGSKANKNFLY